MNNDLISRSALMSRIESERRQWGEDYDAEQILGDIEDFPTAYDVDKVVEQLEEKKALNERMIAYEAKNGTVTEEYQARRAVEILEQSLEIVKGGGVDEN